MQAAGDCGGGLDFAPMASQQCWGCHCGAGVTQDNKVLVNLLVCRVSVHLLVSTRLDLYITPHVHIYVPN